MNAIKDFLDEIDKPHQLRVADETAMYAITCLFAAGCCAMVLLGAGWSGVVILMVFCMFFIYRAVRAIKRDAANEDLQDD